MKYKRKFGCALCRRVGRDATVTFTVMKGGGVMSCGCGDFVRTQAPDFESGSWELVE